MKGSVETNNVIKLSMDKLALGMFIVAVDRRQQKVAVNQPGQIKHRDTIIKLRKNNIAYVWVDIDRSSDACGLIKYIKANGLTNPLAKKACFTIDEQHAKAKKLLFEAKRLIQKVMTDTYEGRNLDVGHFEPVVEKLIECAINDTDAFRCIAALRTKDAYLLEHSINVAFLLVTFGHHLKLDINTLKQLAIGGMLHDIGKIYIDDEILHKPEKLTAEEFEYIKLHQEFAINILKNTNSLTQMSMDVCLMHHEKLDGTGYPKGLKDEQLPLHGRMGCIVDIFDALTASRCYKEAMSPAAAFKILISLTPAHLDYSLVYEFIRCIGVYPVGSLVLLSNEHVGVVWQVKNRDVLHPIVKCFYSLKHKRYIEVTMIDLLKSDVYIDRGVSPSCLNIDPSPFY